MKLEHFGMAEPGDCRVVFSASAEELEAAVQAEKAAPDAPQDEDDLLTAEVNRAILEGFSPLFAQLMKENDLQPVIFFFQNPLRNFYLMIKPLYLQKIHN